MRWSLHPFPLPPLLIGVFRKGENSFRAPPDTDNLKQRIMPLDENEKVYDTQLNANFYKYQELLRQKKVEEEGIFCLNPQAKMLLTIYSLLRARFEIPFEA